MPMSADQKNTVITAYQHLLASENRGWDDLDDYIGYLSNLDDQELHREASAIFSHHDGKPVKCEQDHPRDKCFVPVLVDASGAIVELYNETGQLHEKNRYILEYYIAMYHVNAIIVEGVNAP